MRKIAFFVIIVFVALFVLLTVGEKKNSKKLKKSATIVRSHG
jgi:predicted secreted protein